IKMDKSDILPIHQFERDIQSIIGKILGGEKDNSYGLNSMDLSAAFTELQNAVPGSGNTGRSFTPPSFEVEILERPKVIIKYVGGPIYIPKSADPNYDDALE
ncbi:MAG TPA: hypothetical protein VFC96_07880, partial [Anaerovoracaceae bacterium]|nr:hypothetical protein [Anaerovoracaceae bacterium]